MIVNNREIKTKTLTFGEINRNEFVEYFLKIGGRTNNDEIYIGPYWEVMISPQTLVKYKSIAIKRVVITFNIFEDRFDEFMDAFNLAFLRCGG